MCEGCWIEAGSPTELPDNYESFTKLCREVYDQPHGGCGGGLHCELDDMNLGDEHIIQRRGVDDSTLTDVERRCLDELKKMTEAQRYACIAKVEGWIE